MPMESRCPVWRPVSEYTDPRMHVGTPSSAERLLQLRPPPGLLSNAAFWLSFVLMYQVVQAGAAPDRRTALAHSAWVVNLERRVSGGLLELDVQRLMHTSSFLNGAAAVVYWCSEFAVVGLALLWVYLRRRSAFGRVRNTLIAAGLIALVGCYLFPTAPPRALAGLGFVDTLAQAHSLNSGHGLLPLPSNQFAAMPSVHSADALIVGVGLALVVRSKAAKLLWLLWPPTVWFCVMATANHFWLDVLGGIAAAAIGALAVWATPKLLRGRRSVVHQLTAP